jgi:hypothetical protein
VPMCLILGQAADTRGIIDKHIYPSYPGRDEARSYATSDRQAAGVADSGGNPEGQAARGSDSALPSQELPPVQVRRRPAPKTQALSTLQKADERSNAMATRGGVLQETPPGGPAQAWPASGLEEREESMRLNVRQYVVWLFAEARRFRALGRMQAHSAYLKSAWKMLGLTCDQADERYSAYLQSQRPRKA